MQIEKINIKNFKGLKSVEKEIGGKNVYLIGGNGTGKTSFIDAVWCGLTGKGLPPEPVKSGNKKGLIEIDLGDVIARTKFTRGKPAIFELEDKNAENKSDRLIKSPRSFLERRVGVLNFSIEEFFAKSDAEQVKYFAKNMNVDFSDLDADIEEISESRKFDKKKLVEYESKQQYYTQDDADREVIKVGELAKEIEAEREKERSFDKIKAGVETRERDNVQRRHKIEALLSELKGYEDAIKVADTEILGGKTWLEDEKNKPDILKIEKLVKKIEDADKINEEIRLAKESVEADKEAEKLTQAIDKATEEIDEKRQEKATRISKAIDIDGLKYDMNEERFLYNNLPFDKSQINTASQLIAGVKIASSMLKELRIIKVDASLIDKVEFDKVLEWSENNNIELFIELVDREAEGLKIEVHEN